MKEISIKKPIFSSQKAGSLYLADNDLLIWDVNIDAGIGREVIIGHLSDIHYNYCNFQDFDEADPVLVSTLEHRHWLAGGAGIPTVIQVSPPKTASRRIWI